MNVRANKYILCLISLLLLSPLSAQKRPEYVGKGNWFVGISGGGAWSLAENSKDSYGMWFPTASFQLGRTVNKSLSFRFTGGIAPQYGSPSKIATEYLPEIYHSYEFNVAEGFVDVMFNILNYNRSYKESELFDMYLSMGAGAIYSFGFPSFVEDWDPQVYPVDTKEVTNPAARFSLIFAHHIAKAWDLQYDFSIVGTADSYNGVKVGKDKSFFNLYTTARLSLLYYFKDHSTGKHRFGDTPRIILDPYVQVSEKEDYAVGDTLNTIISFQIDRDELSTTQHRVLKDVAEYMKQHPDYRFRICGYPDSREGSEATRLLLAEHRCKTVLKMLTRKMGLSEDRFEIEANKREHPRTVERRWNSLGIFFVRI